MVQLDLKEKIQYAKSNKMCAVMSRDQNAGRIHSVRIDNITFERVEVFKYLGTTLTNQNSIAEKLRAD